MSYGKIHSVFWEDEKIDTLSDRAALLALFLVTGSHRNAIGCFRLGLGAIQDLRRFSEWGTEGASKALHELVQMGFIVRDERTGWTLIVNALKHDPINNRNAAIGAAKIAAAIPTNTVVYQKLREKLQPQLEAQLKDLQSVFGYPMRAPSKTLQSPSEAPTQAPSNSYPLPQPQPEPIPRTAPRGADPLVEEFETWWKTYPVRKGRGQALRAFRSVRKRGIDLGMLIAGAERYRDDPNRKPEFTKHGATWLNGECWADDDPGGLPLAPLPDQPPDSPEDAWKEPERRRLWNRILAFRGEGPWHAMYGPKPGEPGCDWPQWLQDEELARRRAA